ncbi:MAG: site-specific integrase [Magnetospirillum sp.]|nr:site-specific integrase [Magnetospirillum sp.]
MFNTDKIGSSLLAASSGLASVGSTRAHAQVPTLSPTSSSPSYLPPGRIREGGEERRYFEYEFAADALEPEEYHSFLSEKRHGELIDQEFERIQIAIDHLTQTQNIIGEKWRSRIDAVRTAQTERAYQKIYKAECSRTDGFDLRRFSGGHRKKVHTACLIWLECAIFSALDYWNNICCKSDDGERQYALQALEFCVWATKTLFDTSAQPSYKKAPARKRYWERLKRLPPNWEFKLEEAARTHGIWYLPICIMLAAGARPEEIALGVSIRSPGCNLVEIELRPVKVRKEKDVGLGVRRITVKADAPWTRALLQATGPEGLRVVRVKSPKKAYDRVTAIMSEIFGKDGKLVTPRVLRHRFASLLKDTNLSLRDRLTMMGHSDPKTFQRYGRPDLNVAAIGVPFSWSAELEPKLNPNDLPI